ncbi:acyl-Coenzyme A oxidase [Blyttiomyces sp. JEL0837]|nr:acyl-Coenzyme A oxidase [Blyttiomyces sp. JEL0837]
MVDVDTASKQPMLDIERERKGTSFNAKKLCILRDGGIEKHQARMLGYQMLIRDPLLRFDDGHPFDLSREDMRVKTMQQIRRFIEIKKTLKDPLIKDALYLAMCENSESFAMRTYVHDMLYKTSITLFGTDEQKSKLLPDVDDYKVFGCFAMTELGHSSSLRDLETTSTLDISSDEWIIHSPTLTSTKWWIGMAGQTATHTVMVAQTIVQGKNYGLNWFILPLRDVKTGRLLPGITCGDIGAKAGRNGLDNGWIQATQARIPRENLLMKWTHVDAKGDVSPPPHPAIVYATLIPERLSALTALRILLGQSITIACRYGVTRRQGASNQQILDYQAQYMNLMPIMAGVHVYHFVESGLTRRWNEMQAKAADNPAEYLSQLPDIHSISAGMKAVAMWWGADSLELCRRSAGGHAYSAYNAIAGHIGDWGVLTTGGGDNFPMAQQLARYVLNCVERSLQGKRNAGYSALFLNDSVELLKKNKWSCPAAKHADFQNLQYYLDMFSHLTVKLASRILERMKDKKGSKEEAWNNEMVDLIKLCSLFSHRYIFAEFIESLDRLRTSSDAELVPILEKCGVLFAANTVRLEFVSIALEEGYITAHQSQKLRESVALSAKELRRDAVGLSDAIGFPDFILKAPIGRADGDIYTHYFSTVTKAPDCFKTPYFEAEVLPILAKM